MQQDPLVAFRELEHLADVRTRQSLDVTQRYHLPLQARQLPDRLAHKSSDPRGIDPVLDGLCPLHGRVGPGAVGRETIAAEIVARPQLDASAAPGSQLSWRG